MSSFEDLDARCAKAKKQAWNGRDLPFPVLLDESGKTVKEYGVRAFPTLYLIDPEGKLVGQADLADLCRVLEIEYEPEERLAAPAGGAEEKAQTAEPAPPAREGEWRLAGEWSSVSAAADSSALCLRSDARLTFLTGSGEELGEVALAGSPDDAELLRLGGGRLGAVLCERLGGRLRAVDGAGEELWTRAGRPINSVTTGDVDGDGVDEVLVARTASGSVEVLDAAGETRFTCEGLGNARDVAVGNLLGDAAPEIVAVSAWGRVHVFGPTGEELAVLEPEAKPHAVAVADPGGRGSVLLFEHERGAERGRLLCLDAEGGVRFEQALPAELTRSAKVVVSPRGRWAAVAGPGALVVLDLLSGEEAHREADSVTGSVAWIAEGSGETLLVCGEGNLRALPFVSDF